MGEFERPGITGRRERLAITAELFGPGTGEDSKVIRSLVPSESGRTDDPG